MRLKKQVVWFHAGRWCRVLEKKGRSDGKNKELVKKGGQGFGCPVLLSLTTKGEEKKRRVVGGKGIYNGRQAPRGTILKKR